jgi:hypothetical protein
MLTGFQEMIIIAALMALSGPAGWIKRPFFISLFTVGAG